LQTVLKEAEDSAVAAVPVAVTAVAAATVAAGVSPTGMAASVVMAVVNLAEDIPPAEAATLSPAANPAAKTTGVKAGKTSVITITVRADTAAIVASQAENVVTAVAAPARNTATVAAVPAEDAVTVVAVPAEDVVTVVAVPAEDVVMVAAPRVVSDARTAPASRVENAVTVRDRVVTRNVPTIRAAIGRDNHTVSRHAGTITIGAVTIAEKDEAEKTEAGGIEHQTKSLPGLVTKRLSGVAVWTRSRNTAGVDQKTIVDPTNALRKMSTIG